MKLRYSPRSPYVRKACVVAVEAGVDDRIERVATSTADPDSGLRDDNPLGKIPALILDEGDALFDSLVICEYLDSIGDGAALFPADGPDRWDALRRHAQADGVIDATYLRRHEGLRDAAQQSQSVVDHYSKAIVCALDAFEGEVDGVAERVDIGTVTLGVALGYLDFRAAADKWREGRPKLTAWYEGFAARPSMRATEPSEG